MLLQRHLASIGITCSVTQKNDLLDRLRKLESRIAAYEQRTSVIMKLDDETMWSIEDRPILDISLRADELSDDIPDLASNGWFTLEVE